MSQFTTSSQKKIRVVVKSSIKTAFSKDASPIKSSKAEFQIDKYEDLIKETKM